MKKILLILALILLPILGSAETVEVNGLNYLLNEEEKTATVTSSNYEGFLKIPETIQVGYNEYTVTAIADNALWVKDKLLSVSLSKSLKTIGARAFYYCSGLTSIKIGDGLEGIGEEVFAFCSSLNQIYINDLKQWCMIDFASASSNPLSNAHHLYLDKKEIKELVIPEGIEAIKQYSFYGGANITTLVMNSGIKEINRNAFSFCTSLTNVRFPETLVSIGSYAFESTNIEELDIPNGITTINENTFFNCSKLEKIKLPESLQLIKNSAFSECSGLRNVTIPANVELIQNNAFRWSTDESVDFFMNPEYPPLAYENSFPSNSKFYVPDGSIEPYQNVVPWNNYELHTFSGSGPEKCALPVITYKNETLSFSSETPDVVFHYVITSADGQKNIGCSLNVSGKLLVSVYASKSGYEDSETVESEIDVRGIKRDLNGDGVVNVADHVMLSDIIMNNE